MTASLVERLLRGEPAALARAITAVETESARGRDILRAVQPRLGRARLVGFTGPPGAGKSTLVGAYVGELRKRGKSVGVIAVDPSSPISGGAILGDRLRMTEHAGDPGVFIRSLASRGHLGGLSPAASRIADLMDAAGKDVVILETVGAGQSEVEVAEVADVAVVVCAPGLGDDVQAIKAGILEIADVLVVNKSDLPLADRTRRQLKAMLQLRAARVDVAVLSTTATSGEGVAALADAVEAVWAAKGRPPPGTRLKRIIAEAAAREIRAKILASPQLAALSSAVERGELDVATAAAALVRALGED
ncbi:MAG: methylmalonyl Co-A mutase-associated GTPase MeaB [Rhodospirillales bacterium]|nr:methylmalonyl Co-A mutase-associated GTPase MeaB [Rhodospirillales bacterium]